MQYVSNMLANIFQYINFIYSNIVIFVNLLKTTKKDEKTKSTKQYINFKFENVKPIRIERADSEFSMCMAKQLIPNLIHKLNIIN